jgi:hypothetical protein
MIQPRCIAVCRARHLYYVIVLGLPEGVFRPGEFFEARPHRAIAMVVLSAARCLSRRDGQLFAVALKVVLCSRVFPDFSIIQRYQYRGR